jgi:hypothetical protein
LPLDAAGKLLGLRRLSSAVIISFRHFHILAAKSTAHASAHRRFELRTPATVAMAIADECGTSTVRSGVEVQAVLLGLA